MARSELVNRWVIGIFWFMVGAQIGNFLYWKFMTGREIKYRYKTYWNFLRGKRVNN